jgi:large exoprotein involved in heme utilization and adhesion
VGLQVGQNPGKIQVRGNGHQLSVAVPQSTPIVRSPGETDLQVPGGENLALIGGDIELSGGTLSANPGNIVLGAVEQAAVGMDSSNFTFQFPNLQNSPAGTFRDITLRSQALIDASSSTSLPASSEPPGKGAIRIQGRNVRLADGSLALIQNTGLAQTGDIQVFASQNLDIEGLNPAANISTGLLNEAVAGGNGGDITARADRIRLQAGGAILTRTFRGGTAGDITVRARDRIDVTGFSPRNPTFVSNITTSTFDAGAAGNMEVTTDQLFARDGGIVGSATFGTGQGGHVRVTAGRSIEVTGIEPSRFAPSAISAATFGAGNAGSLRIDTEVLQVRHGGRIDSSTVASGAAGSVLVNASDRIEVQGTVPGSVNPSIIISAANLVDPVIQELFELPPVPSGASGNVMLNTPFLSIRDGALVNARNDGTGDAGQLQVAADFIQLRDGGGMTAATNAGNGGNITLQTQRLQLSENSEISATAGGIGNGGNLAIATELLTLLDGSSITANAFEGLGGNIQIHTQGLFVSSGSTITASSQLGVDGLVNIEEPKIEPSADLLNLETKINQQPPVVASACDRTAGSEFIISGRQNLPPTPVELGNNQVSTWLDWRLSEQNFNRLENSASLPAATATEADTIVEARGWVTNQNGTVQLVAPPSHKSHLSPFDAANRCSLHGSKK